MKIPFIRPCALILAAGLGFPALAAEGVAAPDAATPSASPTLSDLGRSLRSYFTEEELDLLFEYMRDSVIAAFKGEEVTLPPDLSFKLEILLVRMKKEGGHYMDNLIKQLEKDLERNLKEKLKEKLAPRTLPLRSIRHPNRSGPSLCIPRPPRRSRFIRRTRRTPCIRSTSRPLHPFSPTLSQSLRLIPDFQGSPRLPWSLSGLKERSRCGANRRTGYHRLSPV
jgi:hypothetical protein